MTGTPLSAEQFGDMFGTFTDSAFRLEARDSYTLDYERPQYRRFLDGRRDPPPEVWWWRPWLEQMRKLTSEGKRVERVRVVADTPTDYQRWLMWATPWHEETGETIRYLPRSQALRIGLPLEDWWLFDESRLVLMAFSVDGRPVGKTLVTDPNVIEEHLAWQELAICHARAARELTAA